MSEDVEMVVVPGMDGDIGVLPGHSLLITTVRPGVIDVHEGGKVKDSIFVAGGFCEVSPERCTVLAEEAMPLDKIDKSDADKRLSEAQETLSSADDDDKEEAETEVKVAEAMVAAAGRG